jgi:hypothetical protein
MKTRNRRKLCVSEKKGKKGNACTKEEEDWSANTSSLGASEE